jgi:spermidine synthase
MCFMLAKTSDNHRLGFRVLALLAVFALSGFTGLIYESVWSHYIKLFLGHAAYAQTLVLAIFMGGMAIGAGLVGRWATRVAQPLLAYAAVELLLGVFALLFDREFRGFIQWSLDSVLPALGSPAAIQLFKWSGAALLILPQSILLGMTFPLISSGLMRAVRGRPGEMLALLYFANCIGAAIGVIASGFLLIGRVGLPGTLLVAGCLNFLVGFASWLLGRRADHAQVPASTAVPGDRPSGLHLLAVAAFTTGFVAFLYEIAWIRMLSLALGSSTHSFELMLAAFIFGLATGGLWIRRRIDQIPDPLLFLGLVLLLNAALAACTVAGYYYSFDVIAWAKSAFAPTASGYLGYNLVAQTIAIAIMVPVTFLAGMTLPLITLASLRRGSGERAVGTIYAWNTVGCIAGVLVAVHVLMPAFGAKATILTGSVTMLVLALVLARGSIQLPEHRRIAVVAGVTILAVAWVGVAVTMDPRRMVSAVYRTGLVDIPARSEVIYFRDGKTATISLVRESDTITIATNGKPDAALEMGRGPPAADEVTMILAGALPLSLHPAPRRIANIGIGSGLTSAVMLASASVTEVTSIEIEPFMVAAAELAFRPRVDKVFDDPRSRIVIEDAKTFFASRPERFDVIVSEPSNPWISGVATLFSSEFYEQITRYLEADGLLVQWLQIYETDLDVVVSILKALSPHFADYQVFNVDDANILVVASRTRMLGEPRPGIFDSEPMRAELTRAGITGVEDLSSRRVGNRQLLDPFVRSRAVPANSDYFPFVDQNAAKYRFINRNALPLVELTMLPVPFTELALPQWPTLPPAAPPEFARGYRETLVDRAGIIATSIERDEFDRVPAAIARDAFVAMAVDGGCASAARRGAWTEAVNELSRHTTAFLPYVSLQPLWQRITASECYRAASAAEALWPDFMHAVARRDRPEIVRLGQELIAQGHVDEQSANAGYVLTAVGAALYGMGRQQEGVTLIERWPDVARAGGEFGLALQVLGAASF